MVILFVLLVYCNEGKLFPIDSSRILSLLKFIAGTSITMSPLGTVSVCPGGQVLLTCERTSDSVLQIIDQLHWTISIPHPMTIIRERIVTSQGIISPEFRIGFTEFNVILTSESPLTSQLLINNVTAEMNGTTIYCSEDGDETNATMMVVNVNVIYKGIITSSVARMLLVL